MHRLATSSSTSIISESDRSNNDDHHRRCRRRRRHHHHHHHASDRFVSPNRCPDGVSPLASAAFGDLQTIYRHFLNRYVGQNGVKSDIDDAESREVETPPKMIIRRTTEAKLALLDEQPDVGDNGTSTSGSVIDGHHQDVAEYEAQENAGSAIVDAELVGVREQFPIKANLYSSIKTPVFKGHYNYGFEYETWAHKDEELRCVSSDTANQQQQQQ